MNLTGKQLVEQGIITGDIAAENIAQHGVDLNLIAVSRLDGLRCGVVPLNGKTTLASRTPQLSSNGADHWILQPGAYDITLRQGCKVPADKKLLIRQRSSVLRNGAMIHSSVFDAGFETENIGTIMFVFIPICIEIGARVCQIYSSNSNEVENLYDGQWQNDKQRTDGRVD